MKPAQRALSPQWIHAAVWILLLGVPGIMLWDQQFFGLSATIEGMKDYVKIYLTTATKPVITKMSLKALEDKLLPYRLVRIQNPTSLQPIK